MSEAIDGSTAISLLFQFTQKNSISPPIFSYSTIQQSPPLHKVKLKIQEFEFTFQDKSRSDAKKHAAALAVTHYRNLQEPFFLKISPSTSAVSQLHHLCQGIYSLFSPPAIDIPNPHYVFKSTISGSLPPFKAIIHVAAKTFNSVDVHSKKQAAKEDAANVAYLFLLEDPAISKCFHSKTSYIIDENMLHQQFIGLLADRSGHKRPRLDQETIQSPKQPILNQQTHEKKYPIPPDNHSDPNLFPQNVSSSRDTPWSNYSQTESLEESSYQNSTLKFNQKIPPKVPKRYQFHENEQLHPMLHKEQIWNRNPEIHQTFPPNPMQMNQIPAFRLPLDVDPQMIFPHLLHQRPMPHAHYENSFPIQNNIPRPPQNPYGIKPEIITDNAFYPILSHPQSYPHHQPQLQYPHPHPHPHAHQSPHQSPHQHQINFQNTNHDQRYSNDTNPEIFPTHSSSDVKISTEQSGNISDLKIARKPLETKNSINETLDISNSYSIERDTSSETHNLSLESTTGFTNLIYEMAMNDPSLGNPHVSTRLSTINPTEYLAQITFGSRCFLSTCSHKKMKDAIEEASKIAYNELCEMNKPDGQRQNYKRPRSREEFRSYPKRHFNE